MKKLEGIRDRSVDFSKLRFVKARTHESMEVVTTLVTFFSCWEQGHARGLFLISASASGSDDREDTRVLSAFCLHFVCILST